MKRSLDGNEPRSTRRQATRWDTQDAAWSDIQPRLGTLNALVLDAITQQPGTCDELEVRHECLPHEPGHRHARCRRMQQT